MDKTEKEIITAKESLAEIERNLTSVMKKLNKTDGKKTIKTFHNESRTKRWAGHIVEWRIREMCKRPIEGNFLGHLIMGRPQGRCENMKQTTELRQLQRGV